jgi:hypothetical protein
MKKPWKVDWAKKEYLGRKHRKNCKMNLSFLATELDVFKRKFGNLKMKFWNFLKNINLDIDSNIKSNKFEMKVWNPSKIEVLEFGSNIWNLNKGLKTNTLNKVLNFKTKFKPFWMILRELKIKNLFENIQYPNEWILNTK